MVTDPIADLLTRIRNATRVGYPLVSVQASKVKERLLGVLLASGYIHGFERAVEKKKKNEKSAKPVIKIQLRYTGAGKPAVREIKRLSRPGKRVYVRSEKIPRHRGGLGTVIVSTSQGMMTDADARQKGLGGELICSVF